MRTLVALKKNGVRMITKELQRKQQGETSGWQNNRTIIEKGGQDKDEHDSQVGSSASFVFAVLATKDQVREEEKARSASALLPTVTASNVTGEQNFSNNFIIIISRVS